LKLTARVKVSGRAGMKRNSAATSGKREEHSAPRSLAAVSRYDANIDHILRSAAAVFAEKSFGLASIREIAAHWRISFPLIFYYLRNKEELLYLISKRAFEQLIQGASESIGRESDPGNKLKRFIELHLD